PRGLRWLCDMVDGLARRRTARSPDLLRRGLPVDRAVAADAIGAFLCAELAHTTGRPAWQVEKLLAGAFPEGVEVAPAFALRGLLALEKGRLTKALDDAERALALNPDEARACLVRGRVRLGRRQREALGDPGEAGGPGPP